MKISGFIKSSLIDYPGNIAAVVFTQGCNFRCGFCHNPDLLETSSSSNLFDEEEVLEYLKSKRAILDGVVITGGEPTIQPGLVDFISKLKKLGFLVKLDSNGTNPKLIKQLIDQQLIDYVAMDIKGKLSDYKRICGLSNTSPISETINILKNSEIENEFRTTVLPFYHSIEDFNEIGAALSDAKKYTIQGFRPEITYLDTLKSQKPFTLTELEKIKEIMKNYVNEVVIYANL